LLSLAIFVLARATGDPLSLVLPLAATEEDYTNARRYLGLDRPLPEQYVSFLVRAARGDFGTSLRARRPVNELLRERFPNSLKLAGFAMALSLLVAFPLGVAAAARKGTPVDTAAKTVAALGQALPTFWVGIVLIEVVAGRLQWLPAGGTAGLAGVASPADPYAQHLRSRLAPPIWSPDGSWQHPLGTDRLGRDLLSRLFYGARVSLAAGVVTVALAGAVGGGVGLVAGYLRGRTGAL